MFTEEEKFCVVPIDRTVAAGVSPVNVIGPPPKTSDVTVSPLPFKQLMVPPVPAAVIVRSLATVKLEVTSSVAPLRIRLVESEGLPRLASEETERIPARMLEVPLNVFVPASTRVPLPVFLGPAEPAIVPLSVSGADPVTAMEFALVSVIGALMTGDTAALDEMVVGANVDPEPGAMLMRTPDAVSAKTIELTEVAFASGSVIVWAAESVAGKVALSALPGMPLGVQLAAVAQLPSVPPVQV